MRRSRKHGLTCQRKSLMFNYIVSPRRNNLGRNSARYSARNIIYSAWL